MSSGANTNRALLITVVVLAIALVVVVLYFTVLSKPVSKTSSPNASSSSSSSPSSPQLINATPTEAFMSGVEDWIGLECVYQNYGSTSALNLIHTYYSLAYEYLYYYSETQNMNYYIDYPVVEYNALASEYPNCAVNYSISYLYNYAAKAYSNVTGIMQSVFNAPSNMELGTPMFLVYDRANNVTYVITGASTLPFAAMLYEENETMKTFTYQGYVIAYSFIANSTQASFIEELAKTGIAIGNPNAKFIFIEFLDPTCPYCALFDVEYSSYINSIINNGTIYYVAQYYPTHVFGYIQEG